MEINSKESVMALALKDSKKTWRVMTGLLFIIILVLVLVLVWMIKGNSARKDETVLNENKAEIVAALEANLKFYSPGVSYETGKTYIVAERYAVVLLDVAGVTYKALLEYETGEDNWKVLSYPRIVFSYEDFPEVSSEVLRAANGVGR